MIEVVFANLRDSGFNLMRTRPLSLSQHIGASRMEMRGFRASPSILLIRTCWLHGLSQATSMVSHAAVYSHLVLVSSLTWTECHAFKYPSVKDTPRFNVFMVLCHVTIL